MQTKKKSTYIRNTSTHADETKTQPYEKTMPHADEQNVNLHPTKKHRHMKKTCTYIRNHRIHAGKMSTCIRKKKHTCRRKKKQPADEKKNSSHAYEKKLNMQTKQKKTHTKKEYIYIYIYNLQSKINNNLQAKHKTHRHTGKYNACRQNKSQPTYDKKKRKNIHTDGKNGSYAERKRKKNTHTCIRKRI